MNLISKCTECGGINKPGIPTVCEDCYNDGKWEDKEDEWTEEIKAAHPIKTGDHEQYAVAMKMISNRHSKAELVCLVNWLLGIRDDGRFDCNGHPQKNGSNK